MAHDIIAYTAVFATLFVLLVSPHHPRLASALVCQCTNCDNSSFCETDGAPESACYRFVEKVYVEENKTFLIEYDFGCLSSNKTLAHMQCRTLFNISEAKEMKCCRNRDYCNYDLEEPDFLPMDSDTLLTKSFLSEIRALFSSLALNHLLVQILIIISVFIAIVGIFVLLSRKIKRYVKTKQCTKLSECSDHPSEIKVDPSKFGMFPSFSSTPTASTFSAYDDSHKGSYSEGFNSTSELTSGKGDRLLMERTPARAVMSGPMELVGQGRFGRVYRSIFFNEEVAVKAFRSIEENAWRREEMFYVNFKVNHPNILRHIVSELTSFNGSIEYWMIMEFCPHGSLYDFLNRSSISEEQAARILLSTASGISYLHENHGFGSEKRKPRIAHRDIKSKNILMKTPDTCCLADLGHAAVEVDRNIIDTGKQHDHDLRVGTIRYMAPEILQPPADIDINYFGTFAKADLYQFGLVIWEVSQKTSLPPYRPNPEFRLPFYDKVPENPRFEHMIQVVCNEHYRPHIEECWLRNPVLSRLAELMPECWRQDPNARMDTLAVKKRLKELCLDIEQGRTRL